VNKQSIKPKISIVPLILVLTLSATLLALPSAAAQEEHIIRHSFPVLVFSSNPVGVNQPVLITYGITDATTWPQPGWKGLRITIERPDGQIETFENLKTDTTGLSGMTYTPTLVGTYRVKLYFPEQELEYPTLGLPAATMLASETERELIVQEEPRMTYPGHSLPEEYWSRPIDSQLREWYTVTGNWLEVHENVAKRYAPYNEYAPETAHILWTRPLSMGGLAGGAAEIHAFSCGDAYEGLFQNGVIIAGKLFYNLLNTRAQGVLPPESQQVVAVDLHTGELLWQKPLQTPDGTVHNLAFGQQMYWSSFNHHAVYAYLWSTQGSTWHAFDPFTGDWSFSIENVPRGTRVHGKNGELLVYTININGRWMSLWNSTRTVNPQNYGNSNDGSWGRNIGLDEPDRVYSAERGIEWNVTISELPPLTAFYSTLILEDRIIGSNTGNIFGGPQAEPEFWCLSLKPGEEGKLMWRRRWDPPIEDLWVHFLPNFIPSLEDGVFIVQAKETGQNWGFDIDTGEEVWGPTEPLPDMASFTNLYFPRWGQGVGADGVVVLGGGMGGELRGHDVKTGEELWRYQFNDDYTEILWSELWPAIPQFVADGKVYVAHTEHSPLDPKPRGCPFVVLDLKTGEEVFRADGMFRSTRWGGQHIIGDSIMAAMDTYDQRVYAVGKGPSKTTIEAPLTGVPLGSSLVIRGTVMDVSPGTKDPALQMRFPNGVPAVSDESMSDWMRYVYKQFERPDDVTGVTVHLTAIDPNGNFQDLGYVTTDSRGNFGFGFCPEIPGEYAITATFEGSKSYWPSDATTYIVVEEAPAPAEPIEPEVPAEAPLISTELAIVLAVVAIAVIGIVGYWILRRRK